MLAAFVAPVFKGKGDDNTETIADYRMLRYAGALGKTCGNILLVLYSESLVTQKTKGEM